MADRKTGNRIEKTCDNRNVRLSSYVGPCSFVFSYLPDQCEGHIDINSQTKTLYL